jgi:Protein of unknown function (DUF2934)
MDSDAVTQLIRDRAYEISESEDSGTPEENWARAESELRAQDPAEQAALELAKDDGWSDLDDEEHAALEAVHKRTALA